MNLQLGQLREEELNPYRKACAMVEVAQSPTADMTVEQAQRAWMDYYEMIQDLHKRHEVDPDDASNVSIMPSSGRIVLEDD